MLTHITIRISTMPLHWPVVLKLIPFSIWSLLFHSIAQSCSTLCLFPQVLVHFFSILPFFFFIYRKFFAFAVFLPLSRRSLLFILSTCSFSIFFYFPFLSFYSLVFSLSLSRFFPASLYSFPFAHVRGSLYKFSDFFRMGTFIDSKHMKLKSPSK